MYEADGLLHYFPTKSVPIGNITACAADAANPDQRTNTDPNDEERYTFTLSAERDCDGNVAVNLTTTSIQAWPFLYHRRSQHLRARHCCRLSLAVPFNMNVYMYICIAYIMC